MKIVSSSKARAIKSRSGAIHAGLTFIHDTDSSSGCILVGVDGGSLCYNSGLPLEKGNGEEFI